jgi:xylulokinase
LWHPYAYIHGGGLNLEWFRKEIAGSRLSFDELDRLAARITPAEDDPMFVPHLGGRVSPSWPRLGGAWAGLRWSHSVAHLYRAVREAVALEYAIYRNVLRELNPSLRLREVRVTGGGEKSALWNRLKADALGVRVVQIAGAQGAPMGAALVAGFGVGLFKDLDAAARAWIKTGRATLPERKLAGHYARRLARYERLLEGLNQWSS